MIKTAIFVEGQTELIIVREFLLKWFDYKVSLNCYNLFNKNALSETDYNFPNPSATQFYMIINVGNDKAVLSRLLEREANLFKQGYSKIIALRDMYSNEYRKVVKDRTIKPTVNEKFIDLTNEEIKQRASSPNNIHFHFAIMEIEAWLWGLTKVFQKIDSRLTIDFIKTKTGYHLDDDPETTLFQPSRPLAELLQSINKSYNKSKGDVSNFESHIEKQDYENLRQINKCQTFNSFVHTIER